MLIKKYVVFVLAYKSTEHAADHKIMLILSKTDDKKYYANLELKHVMLVT